MRKEIKIYHAYIKESEYNMYFGSIKAVHETLKDIINLSYNYFVIKMKEANVYETDKIKIIRSVLITKPKHVQKKK